MLQSKTSQGQGMGEGRKRNISMSFSSLEDGCAAEALPTSPPGDRSQGKEKEEELMSKEAIGGVGEGAAKPSRTWCPLFMINPLDE